MKKLFLFTSFLALSFLGFAQTIIYVRSGASGSGSSWADACDLLAGAAKAKSEVLSGKRPEIWVKAGIYYPSQTVEIADLVKVFGGFEGSESRLSQRNYARNVTILDGQKNFGVISLGKNAVLNGFTIQNGSAHAPDRRSGGGIWMKELARVENCYLLNNQALDEGGGLYAEGDGLVVNSVFAQNKATRDGVAIYGNTLELRNNTITDNALMKITPQTDVTRPTQICSGSRATLTVLDPGSYRWSSGQTTAQITTAALTADATYTVTVMPSDKSSVFELKFEVRVKALPTLTITTNKSTANVGDTVLFTAHATPLGGSYFWDDLNASADSLLTQVMQATGDLSYRCTYTLDGCEATATASVRNNRCTPPTVPDALAVAQTALCVGDSLALQLQGGQLHSGSWVLYGGSCGGTRLDSSRAASPCFWVKPTSATTYYVRGEGCGEQTACVSVAISVNPLPSAMVAPDSLCQNLDIQLTSLTPGGTWTSDAQGLVEISASGLLTAKQPSTALLRYTLPATGCYREHELTILPAPEYVNGLDAFCAGTTNTYQGGPIQGGRFRVTPTTYASIDPITGELTTQTNVPSDQSLKVYYAYPDHRCESSKEVTIYQNPLPITGPRSVCAGDTLLLNNATTPAGIWLSDNTLVGDFVSSNNGRFAARTAGTVLLSYALAYCTDTFVLKVQARPSSPLLSINLCEGASAPVSMSSFYPGGSWSVAPAAVATVDSMSPTTATLTGLRDGRFTLTYTLPSGCYSRTTDSIYLAPTPIVGDSLLSLHKEDTLKSTPTGGYWENSVNSVLSVQTYNAYALMEAVGVGTSTVTYLLPGSRCSASKKIRVEPCATITAPPTITSQQSICAHATILPIHYSYAYAPRIVLSWTDALGNPIAQPAGIVLDTTTAGRATLTGSIASSGVYQYKLTTVDHFGGCPQAAMATGRITVYPELKGGKIGSNQHICQGTTPAAFTSVSLPSGGAGGGTYLWQRQPFSSNSWQDLAGSNNVAFDDLSLITESHRYRRQFTNACGVTYSDTAVVQIDSLPVVSSATVDSNTSCTGGNGRITLTLKNPTDVVMSIDQFNFQTTPVFSNLTAGSYSIDLRNTRTSCQSEYTVEVKTSDRDVPQFQITGRDSICVGDSTLWRASILNDDGSTYRYQWSCTGSPNFSSAGSVRLKGPSGSYELVVTHEGSSCVGRLSRALVVMPPVVITEFSYFGQGDTTLCEDENLRFKVGATSSGLPRTYAWHRAEDANFTVNAEIVSASSEFPYTPSTARTRYYKAVVSSPFAICPSVSSPVIKATALPRPLPAINGPSAACTGDEIQLSVAPQTGWTYRWILGTDTLSRTHEMKARPNTDNSLYQLLAHNGYCSELSSRTVALRLRPTFEYADIQSGATLQSVCHNGALQEIRAKVENATGLVLVWQGTPLNSLHFDGSAMIISGSVTEAPGVYPYLCYTTGQAPECPADTAKGVITILSPLEAGSIRVPSFICSHSIPAPFTSQFAASGGAHNGSYQWRQSTDGNNWSDIVGATDPSIQISTPLTQKTYYRRMYKNACGNVYTAPKAVSLRALPDKPVFAIADNTNCSGGSNGSIRVTAPLGMNYEYSLHSQLNYSSDASFSALTEGLYCVYVRDLGTSCLNSDTARVRNAGSSNIPEFSIATNLPGGTDSVCSSSTAVTLTAHEIANCSGTTYAWWKSSEPNTILSTTQNLLLATTNDGDVYFLKITNSDACDATVSRRITVVSPLAITSQPQSDTACGAISPITFAIGIGNNMGRLLSYQWQRKATTAGASWENIGSNSNSYTTGQANKDTTLFFRCLVQVQNSAICPALVSQQAHMQMLSTPAPKISGDTAICGGYTTVLSVPNVYTSYAWMLNGNPIPGASSASLTTLPAATSQEYRVRVNNGYCEGTSLVTVKAFKSAAISMPEPSETNLCYQAPFSRKIVVRQATGLEALLWSRDGSNIVQPTGVTFTTTDEGKTDDGADTCVYELSGSFDLAASYTYRMKTTGHASACPAATRSATLLANASVQGGEIETASHLVCYNTPAAPMTSKVAGSGGYGTPGDGTTKYQWYSDAAGQMDAISGATNPSYNPNAAAEQLTSNRSYVRKYTNQCGEAYSNTLAIAVKSVDPAPMLTLEHQTSCSSTPNGKITVTLPSGSDYEFSKDGGATFQDSPIFAQLAPVSGLQLVARHKSSGCRTAATTAEILNKIDENRPQVTFAVYPNDSVCANDNTVGIKATVVGAGTNPTFLWSPAAPDADSISVTAPSQNNVMKATEYSLTVTNNQTSCLSLPGTSTKVYVFPPVVISQQPVGGVVCVDGNANGHVLSISVENTSSPRKYQWQRSATANGLYENITVGGQSASYAVATTTPSDYWYRCAVSGGYGICSAVYSTAVRFQVLAKPSVPEIFPADQYICDGTSATLTVQGHDRGNTLLWSANAGSANTESVTVSPVAIAGTAGAPYYYTVSASNGVCASTSAEAVVRVSRKHHVNHVGDPTLSLHDQTACGGTAITSIEHNATGGAASWSPVAWRTPNGNTSTPTWINETRIDNAITLSGTTPTALGDSGVYHWKIYTVGVPNNVCPADTMSGTIFVGLVPSQTLINGEIAGNSAACSDTLHLVASGGLGGTIYFQGVNSNGTSTSTPSSEQKVTTSGTYYFRALSVHGCWGLQGQRTLTFAKPPVIGTQPSPLDTTLTLYSQNFPTLKVKATGTGPLSYLWYRNTVASNEGGMPVPSGVGGNTPNYTPDKSLLGPFWYYCVVSNKCTSTSEVSGMHSVRCSYPVLTLSSEASRHQTIENNGCSGLSSIHHSASGAYTHTITWSGPRGDSAPEDLVTVRWDLINGNPNVLPAELGTYTWTITATNLACSTTSSGTIRVVENVRPVLSPNTEATIDGKLYVADHEGNVYKTVQIGGPGGQTWIAENMRCTTSPNNVAPWLEKSGNQYSSNPPYYSDPSDPCYGLLYNWAATMDILLSNVDFKPVTQHRGMCPLGWHVPSDEEWCALEQYFENVSCSSNVYRGNHAALLASNSRLWITSGDGTSPAFLNCPGWYAINTNHNLSGFSALPAGFYTNYLQKVRYIASFWTSTMSNFLVRSRDLDFHRPGVSRGSEHPAIARSVRCVKD